eukprot:TRINITY_DN29228_c0_g1_i1.p1 TRINITY_DN29228_c0_g1~~TRINITY_DN29228_c0_g1_i1.p1  ORF type:complete len:496 (+),score=68.86 TRINITY_DN29228_c0_g1_i1:270-1757(+)
METNASMAAATIAQLQADIENGTFDDALQKRYELKIKESPWWDVEVEHWVVVAYMVFAFVVAALAKLFALQQMCSTMDKEDSKGVSRIAQACTEKFNRMAEAVSFSGFSQGLGLFMIHNREAKWHVKTTISGLCILYSCRWLLYSAYLRASAPSLEFTKEASIVFKLFATEDEIERLTKKGVFEGQSYAELCEVLEGSAEGGSLQRKTVVSFQPKTVTSVQVSSIYDDPFTQPGRVLVTASLQCLLLALVVYDFITGDDSILDNEKKNKFKVGKFFFFWATSGAQFIAAVALDSGIAVSNWWDSQVAHFKLSASQSYLTLHGDETHYVHRGPLALTFNFVVAFFINQIGLRLTMTLLPLILCSAGSYFDFVKDIIAYLFIVQLDDCESRRILVCSSVVQEFVEEKCGVQLVTDASYTRNCICLKPHLCEGRDIWGEMLTEAVKTEVNEPDMAWDRAVSRQVFPAAGDSSGEDDDGEDDDGEDDDGADTELVHLHG